MLSYDQSRINSSDVQCRWPSLECFHSLLTHSLAKSIFFRGYGGLFLCSKTGNSREEGGLNEIPSRYGYFLELRNIIVEQQLFRIK